MKKFVKRKKIEDATMFRVEYHIPLEPRHHKDFNSRKSMDQWITRNDAALILRTLALINDEWEPYTTIGKSTITLQSLELIIKNLKFED